MIAPDAWRRGLGPGEHRKEPDQGGIGEARMKTSRKETQLEVDELVGPGLLLHLLEGLGLQVPICDK